MSNALTKLAESTGVSVQEIKSVISGMIVSAKNQHGATASDAEITVVSSICSQYELNPLTKEAHALISGGKLSVIVGIDGYIKIMNRQTSFDGVEFEDNFNGEELISVTTKIHIKGRSFPTCVTEYMDECYQPNSQAWKKFKKRMLRNKSLAQCVRVAFGITEIIDNDEADRIKSSESARDEVDITLEAKIISIEDFDIQMSECGDLEMLKQVCSEIRKKLEAKGSWMQYKQEIINLNEKHKSRIESYSSVEDAEFDEAIEQTTTSSSIYSKEEFAH